MPKPPVNYCHEMHKVIKTLDPDMPPRLLLHACCAPCASGCLEQVLPYFKVTLLFFNPNITGEAEYVKRLDELRRLVSIFNEDESFVKVEPINLIETVYNPALFNAVAAGFEGCPEGGARCVRCYRRRIGYTADVAAEERYDFYSSTLTLSPKKDEKIINMIGEAESKRVGVRWLWSDFKKDCGFDRSLALCERYGLYRQNYCGCDYSIPSSRVRISEV